jgi:hypothetical protein
MVVASIAPDDEVDQRQRLDRIARRPDQLRSKASRWVRSPENLATDFRGQLIFQLKFVEVRQEFETERENERAQDRPRSHGAGKTDNVRTIHALFHRKR